MSDFKKQYDKELKYQEEKSNKYTLNGVVMLIALELVVWALNAIGIFEIDRRTITVAVIISIILLIPIVFMIMNRDDGRKFSIGRIAFVVFLLIFGSFQETVDFVAHIGGFIAGAVLAIILCINKRKTEV